MFIVADYASLIKRCVSSYNVNKKLQNALINVNASLYIHAVSPEP